MKKSTYRFASVFATFLSSNYASLGAQSALEAWRVLNPAVRDCVALAAERSNQPLEGIIANGVLPTDSRLAGVMNFCQKIVEGPKANYSCILRLPTGESVKTLCNQAFGYKEAGGFRKITKEEALRDAFRAGSPQMMVYEEETPAGLEHRQREIKQALVGVQSASGAPQRKTQQGDTSGQPTRGSPATAHEGRGAGYKIRIECSNGFNLRSCMGTQYSRYRARNGIGPQEAFCFSVDTRAASEPVCYDTDQVGSYAVGMERRFEVIASDHFMVRATNYSNAATMRVSVIDAENDKVVGFKQLYQGETAFFKGPN